MFEVKAKRDIKLKSGKVIKKDTRCAVLDFLGGGNVIKFRVDGIAKPVLFLTRNAHINMTKFTEMPSQKALSRMATASSVKTVSGYYTEPDGHGPDGSPSWLLAFGLI